MPAYEICYLDEGGSLTYKFSATCDDDQRAKVLAHAMKLPSARKLEVWSGDILIYTRPSAVTQQPMLRASPRVKRLNNSSISASLITSGGHRAIRSWSRARTMMPSS